MANNSLRPPWIKTAASRNIAKRARLAAIAKRNGIAPPTKAQARAECAAAAAVEPAPPYPGMRPNGIAERAMRLRDDRSS